MISIYELRLRYLFARHVDSHDRRMFDFLLLDSGRAALFFLFAYLKKYRGIEDVYVNLYTTEVVHDILRQVGCRIHPIDIDPLNFRPRLYDVTNFQGYAFLHTGLFGFPSFDEEVLQRVKRGGGVFVEDSCNSFGCRIAHKEAGTLGDASIFSFRVGKALSTSGGALKINDSTWKRDICEQFSKVPAFSKLQGARRLFRTYLDYVLFEPWVLEYISRPLRQIQKRTAFLSRLVKGGAVDTLTSVNVNSIRRMSESEAVFASRRLARFDEEFRQKREVSDLLRRKLEKYPVYIYANDPDSYKGWNCLFFPLLLERGDPESFVSYLRRQGFDATRFHHEVPQKSFPNLDRSRFPGTYTLVDRLVCVPNTTRMVGRVDKMVNTFDTYFARLGH